MIDMDKLEKPYICRFSWVDSSTKWLWLLSCQRSENLGNPPRDRYAVICHSRSRAVDRAMTPSKSIFYWRRPAGKFISKWKRGTKKMNERTP